MFGEVRNEPLQRAVVQTDPRERDNVNVQVEFASDTLNEGRLPGSGSSILNKSWNGVNDSVDLRCGCDLREGNPA